MIHSGPWTKPWKTRTAVDKAPMKSTQTRALTNTEGGFLPRKKSFPRAKSVKLHPMTALPSNTTPIIKFAVSVCICSAEVFVCCVF